MRLLTVLSRNHLPDSGRGLGRKELQDQIDDEAQKGEPEYRHEQPEKQAKQTEYQLEDEQRHKGKDGKSEQIAEHFRFLTNSGQAAVRHDVSNSFIGSLGPHL
jgi:hypothetical protein